MQRSCGVSQQGAVRGEWLVLYKRWNAAAEAHRSALRVGLSVPMDIVAPLAKDYAITCEALLAMLFDNGR